jgi:hypothetical protein
MKMTGKISTYVSNRNFGFLTSTDPVTHRVTRYFFHSSNFSGGIPAINAAVLFNIHPIMEGSNPSAVDVELVIPGVEKSVAVNS